MINKPDLSFLTPEEQVIEARKYAPASTRGERQQNVPRYPIADARLQDLKPKGQVSLLCATAILMKPINWLWLGFIASGKFHVLGGAPAAGKTTLAVALAAIVSNGGLWPDGTQAKQGKVIFWSGEDDPADTLKPRLVAVGANMENIYFIGPVTERDVKRPFDPAKDMQSLEEAIIAIGGAAMLIVDPIVSAVAGDSHKNSETRRALQPIVDLGERTGVAILGITHFTKGTTGRDPLERITGSLAFAALARIVFVAAKEADPEDHYNPNRFFTRAKSNIGPDGGGYEYLIENVSPIEGIETSRVVFGDTIEGTAREILATADAVEENMRSPKLETAKEFLEGILQSGDWVLQKEIEAAADDASIASKTLRNAKKDLGVESKKKGLGPWYWRLPVGNHDTSSTLPEWETLAHDDLQSTKDTIIVSSKPATVTF